MKECVRLYLYGLFKQHRSPLVHYYHCQKNPRGDVVSDRKRGSKRIARNLPTGSLQKI